MRRNILHINGDDHRRLRNLVNPAFTPRAADRWRPAMREFLERLWEPLADADRCEFVDAFAKPYPSLTIATVMGAPLDDAPKLHEWSNLIQRQFDGPSLMHERDAIERACEEFYEWAGALIERRRDDPSDDLISTLIAAEQEGDRLSDVECMNLVLNVLVGGVDTTQSQLAHALRLFAAHPDQWQLLAERPGAGAGGGRGGGALRADHAVHGAPAARGGRVPRRDVPRGDGGDGLRLHRQPRRRGRRRRTTSTSPPTAATPSRSRSAPASTTASGANLARAELQEALAFLPRAHARPGARRRARARLGPRDLRPR